MTGVFIRRGKCHRKTEIEGECHVTEVEIKMLQLQTKEWLELPKAGRGKEGSSLFLGLLQNCERTNFCCFKPSSFRHTLLQQPQDTNNRFKCRSADSKAGALFPLKTLLSWLITIQLEFIAIFNIQEKVKVWVEK